MQAFESIIPLTWWQQAIFIGVCVWIVAAAHPEVGLAIYLSIASWTRGFLIASVAQVWILLAVMGLATLRLILFGQVRPFVLPPHKRGVLAWLTIWWAWMIILCLFFLPYFDKAQWADLYRSAILYTFNSYAHYSVFAEANQSSGLFCMRLYSHLSDRRDVCHYHVEHSLFLFFSRPNIYYQKGVCARHHQLSLVRLSIRHIADIYLCIVRLPEKYSGACIPNCAGFVMCVFPDIILLAAIYFWMRHCPFVLFYLGGIFRQGRAPFLGCSTSCHRFILSILVGGTGPQRLAYRTIFHWKPA